MIIVQNVNKKINQTTILNNISLEVKEKEIVSLVGPSGAGKTTLLSIMGTLDKPTSGKVLIDGTDVFALGDKKLSSFRNSNIGFVFQFHHLLPEFTAIENIIVPALIKGEKQNEAEKKAKNLLERVGLAQRMHHKPTELSGGEQQRIAVARALMNNPKIILADEPTGNLDSHNAETLNHLFFNLRDEFGQTFVIVTHNEHLANMADRKIEMIDGKIKI